MIRVLLVDDQPATRAGLRMRLTLDPDLAVVGEAGDGAEALTRTVSLAPDVVVMDLALPGVHGLAATSAIRQQAPGSAVVIHTIHDDPVTRREAREAGAAVFVSKFEENGALIRAIRMAATGSN